MHSSPLVHELCGKEKHRQRQTDKTLGDDGEMTCTVQSALYVLVFTSKLVLFF